VFGRGPDYDPRIDPIVRVQARQLRFKLREYFETTGVADPIRIEMHKGSYLPEISFAPGETLIRSRLPRPWSSVLPSQPLAGWMPRGAEIRSILVAVLFLATAAVGFVLVRFVRPRGNSNHPSDRTANPAARIYT
jgi:hypothetical protein